MGQEEIIARRYADGLALQAAEKGEVAAFRGDLHLLAEAVDPRSDRYVPELADFLANPRVEAGEKAAAAEAVAKKLGACATAGNFLGLLARRGRAGLLPRISALFGDTAGDLTGERTGVVETARELTTDQITRLENALRTAFGNPVRLRQRLDPSLVAGARVTVGGNTIDGSVLGRWRRLRDNLAGGVAEECVRACDMRDAHAADEGNVGK
jgi:F-type H+-transporting ATPase subunit delta